MWRQICLLPNFLAAANPQKEAPPNWKRNSPTFGQVLFFLIILIHFSLGVCSSFDKTNCYLSKPSNLFFFAQIWGGVIWAKCLFFSEVFPMDASIKMINYQTVGSVTPIQQTSFFAKKNPHMIGPEKREMKYES